MGQNELSKYEFELMAHTEVMTDMIRNRIVLTTDSKSDFERAYEVLCDTVSTGMFYLRKIQFDAQSGPSRTHTVYFSSAEDQVTFVDRVRHL